MAPGSDTYNGKIATTIVQSLPQMELFVNHLFRCPIDTIEDLHGHCDQRQKDEVQLDSEANHLRTLFYLHCPSVREERGAQPISC